MSHRYRLTPTPAQEAILRGHCSDARYVWNLCVEQQSWWRPGRGEMPTWVDRCRQLTEARAEFEWLRQGSVEIQKNAIRDFDQAMKNFFGGTHRRPTWRKARLNEGIRVAGARGKDWDVRRLSRNVGEVFIPKVGRVHFRWSRTVPAEAKSYRVTLDRAGHWHVAFAAWPAPTVPGPGTGEVVGIDLGVTVSAALSTGELLKCPGLRAAERTRLRRLERKSARQRVRGRPASNRLKRTYLSIAKVTARGKDRRKDWAEKVSTDLARRFDVIRVEDLRIRNMTRSARGTIAEPGRNVRAKAGLNREIHANGWGLLVKRLEDKAPARVERVNPAYTSLTCNACGHCAPENRKSQAAFACVACGHQANADVNAARNIADRRTAGGRPVAARGDRAKSARSVKREPQRARPPLVA